MRLRIRIRILIIIVIIILIVLIQIIIIIIYPTLLLDLWARAVTGTRSFRPSLRRKRHVPAAAPAKATMPGV